MYDFTRNDHRKLPFVAVEIKGALSPLCLLSSSMDGEKPACLKQALHFTALLSVYVSAASFMLHLLALFSIHFSFVCSCFHLSGDFDIHSSSVRSIRLFIPLRVQFLINFFPFVRHICSIFK